MNQQVSFSSFLMDKALQKSTKIGIGIKNATEEIITGLNKAAAFCQPVVYGTRVSGFPSYVSAKPENMLFDDLEAGRIDAGIRGQISADPFRNRFISFYAQNHESVETMLTVLEFPNGKPMIISPASNFMKDTISERQKFIEASVRLCNLISLPVKIGLLSRCRLDNITPGLDPSIVQSYNDSEQLVKQNADKYEIKHYEIDFEKAYQDGVTILIEPNGTTGNQVIRTLYFLEVVRFYGAPYVNASHIVVETFKNGKDYPDVMLLAAAMANFNFMK